ncbi:MAG TPA: carbohydrate-binding family 9-like protein [Myxococcales bacterium]
MAAPRFLALFAFLALVACRDSSVGPPPRKLAGDQADQVASHLLKQKPTPMTPASTTLGGGKIRYLGSDWRPDPVARGQTLRISHFFESIAPVDKGWKMFVHVEGTNHGGILVNADHVPVDNLYPTDRWQPGQIVEDSYTITVPPTAPDEMVVFIGFYRFDDRLPIDQRSDHDGGNRIPAVKFKVGGEGPSLPTYKAPKRSGEIQIDGALEDPGWKNVPSTGAFLRTIDGGPAHFRTDAKLVWDDEFLYVAFNAEDEDVWAKAEKKDDPLYQEEVVEIFLDADGDGKTYDELELSPKNVQFDAYFPARRTGMDLGWDSGMVSAVKVAGTLNNPADKDQGWSAEMKIPVKNLAAVPRWPPQAGDKWRFNLYRLEQWGERKNNEGTAFSPPLVGDFHHLPRFGFLEFAN